MKGVRWGGVCEGGGVGFMMGLGSGGVGFVRGVGSGGVGWGL